MLELLHKRGTFYLNTSNFYKLKEYERLGLRGIRTFSVDLKEPNSDAITVIRSKATQGAKLAEDSGLGWGKVIVEDTSLDVKDASVGVNVRWLQDELPKLIGKEATFKVLIGVVVEQKVHIYEGKIEGRIVEPQGEGGNGFDKYFLPNGEKDTLAISKPYRLNPRFIALQKFFKDQPDIIEEILTDWSGEWQH